MVPTCGFPCVALRTCVSTLACSESALQLSHSDFSPDHGPTALCPAAPVVWVPSNLKFVQLADAG